MRIGIGYDIHRLREGRPLFMGGVEIPFSKGLEGHSDADVVLHAVCDSILGALGEKDIGARYPDSDPAYKGISSSKLLEDVKAVMDGNGFRVGNLDCVVIAEEPKIGKYRDKMVERIAGILGLEPGAVSIKGKTAESLGEIGSGNAIEAHAAVLLLEK